MAVFTRPRQAFVIAGVLGLALSATACGTGDDKKSNNAGSAECAAYDKYEGHDGKKVSIYASIRDAEADLLSAPGRRSRSAPASRSTTRAAASSRRSSRSGSTAAARPTSPSSPSRAWSSVRRRRQAEGSAAETKTLAEEQAGRLAEVRAPSTASSTACHWAPT